MNHDIAHIGLSEQGHLRIEWAARRMPVLAAIRERFEEERPLEGYRIGQPTGPVLYSGAVERMF